MNFILCDGSWATTAEGALTCIGTLEVLAQEPPIPSGITIEDVTQLSNFALDMFVIAFGFLVLKKVL